MEKKIENLSWRCCNRTFLCGARTLIAGIVNVTPDSFSDGGRFFDPQAAVAHALELVDAGADILDIGGESSRPGAQPVTLEEELHRVIPLIESIRAVSDAPISIDTYKAEVARQALQRGAEIVNDITALQGDPEMAGLVAESGAGVVLMHMLGAPQTMQIDPKYEDVVGEIESFLVERIRVARLAGIALEQICIDPGIGFGKRLSDNLELIGAGWRLRRLDAPVLVGASRKVFIGKLLDSPADQRLEGSLAAAVAAVLCGADIVRVHDMAATRKAVTIADAVKEYARSYS